MSIGDTITLRNGATGTILGFFDSLWPEEAGREMVWVDLGYKQVEVYKSSILQ